MQPIKLFCIPYSGGSADIYYKWKNSLDRNIELCPVEIAGRGRRMNEPFYESVDEAADDISNNILSKIDGNTCYAIWGHSMGSLLAYEAYFSLMEKCSKEPEHIFFSGRKAPHDETEKTEYYKLPDDEFMKIVFHYGGNTKDIMENQQLAKIFLPILRSDFKLAEIYEYKEKKRKVMCDISIINGKSDFSVMKADLDKWKDVAGKECNYYWMKGDHFYILDNISETVQQINQILIKDSLFV